MPSASLPLPETAAAEPGPGWTGLFHYPRSMAMSFLSSIGAQTAAYGITLSAPTLFTLQLGVTPAYAAYLFLYVTAAGIVGRICFAWLADAIGRRNAGMLAAFGGMAAIAAAGYLHDVFIGGTGKIVGPLGLALIVGASNIITLKATLDAIGPAFAYFTAWMALCGCAFLFFGFETGNRSIESIDRELRTPAAPDSTGAIRTEA